MKVSATRAWLAMLAVGVMLGASGRQDTGHVTADTTTLPPITLGATPAEGYHFSGDGGAVPYVTKPFDLSTGRIRITAEGQLTHMPPDCTGPVPLEWKLYRTGDPANWPYLKAGEYSIGCGNSVADDGVSLSEGGSFHLEIITLQPWALTIAHTS